MRARWMADRAAAAVRIEYLHVAFTLSDDGRLAA
jgi:hypothetical protein